MIPYWKKSQEVKHTEIIWFVKDREGEQHLQIYLYGDIPNDNGSYEVLGKVLDMCLIPDTQVVYVLTKLSKALEKIRYQFCIVNV